MPSLFSSDWITQLLTLIIIIIIIIVSSAVLLDGRCAARLDESHGCTLQSALDSTQCALSGAVSELFEERRVEL